MKNISIAAFCGLLLVASLFALGAPNNKDWVLPIGNPFEREMFSSQNQTFINATVLPDGFIQYNSLSGLPKYTGAYLIEFPEEPASVHLAGNSNTPEEYAQTQTYAQWLLTKHAEYIGYISQTIPDFASRPRNDLVLALNGITVRLSAREADDIGKMHFAKKVSPMLMAETYLRESVPIIEASVLWNQGFSGAGVKVAVIDTGINYTHPDFALPEVGACFGEGCKVEGGYDLVNNDADPMDDHGHGTHVGATIAGNGTAGDGLPIFGVAPDATLYIYKVCMPVGGCPGEAIAGSYEYVLDPNQDLNMWDHLDVASMSLGGSSNDPNEPLALGANNMVEGGVIVVIAAGNSGSSFRTIGTPGTGKRVITVGATDKNNILASFSSRGPLNDGSVKPDVLAPGVNICAAEHGSAWASRRCIDQAHVSISGTSMATPHVSGLAALLLQKHPDWSPDEIKFLLRNGANTYAGGYSNEMNPFAMGHGRISTALSDTLPRPIIVELRKTIETGGTVQFEANVAAFGQEQIGPHQYRYDVAYIGPDYNHLWYLHEGMYDQSLRETGIVNIAEGENATITFAEINKTRFFPREGVFLVRLWINNSRNSDYFSFAVKYGYVLTPFDGDVYRDGFEIRGTILMPAEHRYEIAYAPNGTEDWTFEGISLENGGMQAVEDGRLGGFEPSPALPSGLYQFKLQVFNASDDAVYNMTPFAMIALQRDLPEGFPARYPLPVLHYGGSSGYNLYGNYLIPHAADVNNDGQTELSFVRHADDGERTEVAAISPENGQVIGSVQSPIDSFSLPNRFSLQVRDFGSGSPTDVFYNKEDPASSSKIMAQSQTGEVLWSADYLNSTPLMVPWGHNTFAVVADINRDGQDEMIFILDTNFNRSLFVTDMGGNVLDGWPVALPDCGAAYLMPSPAIGNFDADDELEIGYSGESSYTCLRPIPHGSPFGVAYLFDTDGSVMPGWPVDFYSYSSIGSPTSADLNGDGIDEFFVPSIGLWAFYANGSDVEGWPLMTDSYFAPAPSFADIDGDGSPDIIVQDAMNSTSESN
jgi:subtilisin family serine protease